MIRPFYDAYLCADGRYVTIGALEPQFYALLIDKLGLADVDPKAQYDMRQWPALKARFARTVPQPAERGLARAARGQRRVLRAGAEPRRGRGSIRTTLRAAFIAQGADGRLRRPRRRASQPLD